MHYGTFVARHAARYPDRAAVIGTAAISATPSWRSAATGSDTPDQPVPPGGLGEVIMRGRWLFEAYWDDPELTAATYRGSWLRSGDVGYLDEEGYLEAAVIGVPDDEWGERPHAVLAPAPGHDLDADAVHAHPRDRLPTIKRPARVTILEAMPKTSTGKISKPQLRRLLG